MSTMNTFKEYGLQKELLKSLEGLGFVTPSPIQEKTIPFILESKDDLIALAQTAGGEMFLAADGEDISTPDLLRMIAKTMGRSLWLPAIPPGMLRRLARLAGRGADLDQLTGSLCVDASRTQAVVDWQPEKSLREGIGEMTDWYLSRKRV